MLEYSPEAFISLVRLEGLKKALTSYPNKLLVHLIEEAMLYDKERLTAYMSQYYPLPGNYQWRYVECYIILYCVSGRTAWKVHETYITSYSYLMKYLGHDR